MPRPLSHTVRDEPKLRRQPSALTHKKDTQGIGTAVRGDGAAGTGDDDLIKILILPDGVLHQLHPLVGNTGMGDENTVGPNVGASLQAILHILLQRLIQRTAVLFPVCRTQILHMRILYNRLSRLGIALCLLPAPCGGGLLQIRKKQYPFGYCFLAEREGFEPSVPL